MKPHKHAELIKAWADGMQIQKEHIDYDADENDFGNTYWSDDNNPSWDEAANFRIKPTEPEKVYPVTNYTGKELWELYMDHTGTEYKSFSKVANASIRRAIDDGQVVISDFENTWKARANDEWIEKTNWVQNTSTSFQFSTCGMHRADVMRKEIELLRASRGWGRDMKIAKAVLDSANAVIGGRRINLDLAEIIAGVK